MHDLKEFTAFSLYYLHYMAMLTKRTNEGFLPPFASQHLYWIYKRMKSYAKNQKVELMKFKSLWDDLAAVFEKNGYSRSYCYRSAALMNVIPMKRFIALELAYDENELEIPPVATMTRYINQMVDVCLKGEFGESAEKLTSFLLMELMQRECDKLAEHYSNYSSTFLLLIEHKLRELFLQMSPAKLPVGWLADRLLEVTRIYSAEKHVKLIANFICVIIPPSLFFNSMQIKRKVLEMSHSKKNFSDLFRYEYMLLFIADGSDFIPVSLYLQPDYIYEAIEASNIEYKELHVCEIYFTENIF